MKFTEILGILLSIVFIYFVAKALLKNFNARSVLLFSGLIMLLVSYLLGLDIPHPKESTGSVHFNSFQLLKESFSLKGAGLGLMIMSIGGFVAYMKKIGASNALIYIMTKPLSSLKKYPYITAILIIPIGQFLFICIPSATGLGLLLMASLFPVLVSLGITRLTAISVITACTMVDIGPSMSASIQSAKMLEMDIVELFINHQVKLTLITSPFIMLVYYFTNRYFDKKQKEEKTEEKINAGELKVTVPLIYAILPMLPLLLLIFFSPLVYSNLFPNLKPITLHPTTAMMMSVSIALLFEFIRLRNIKFILDEFKTFWDSMGTTFNDVVILIICAEIFSKGLVSLGLIDGLISGAQHLGFGLFAMTVILVLFIFLASMLMGSSNASFFSFSPLVPNIASKFSGNMIDMMLPVQFASSMGRTASPIAGVIIATSNLGKVSNIDLAKRNLIPMALGIMFQMLVSFFIL